MKFGFVIGLLLYLSYCPDYGFVVFFDRNKTESGLFKCAHKEAQQACLTTGFVYISQYERPALPYILLAPTGLVPPGMTDCNASDQADSETRS